MTITDVLTADPQATAKLVVVSRDRRLRAELTAPQRRIDCDDCDGECTCVRSDPAAQRDWQP